MRSSGLIIPKEKDLVKPGGFFSHPTSHQWSSVFLDPDRFLSMFSELNHPTVICTAMTGFHRPPAVILILFLSGLLSPHSATAQGGFQIGLDAPVVSFLSGDVTFDPGVGINMRFPYGITNNLSLGARLGGVTHRTSGSTIFLRQNDSGEYYAGNSWTLDWLMLEARYAFGDSSVTRPYVSGSAGLGLLFGNWDNMLVGVAVGAGAGIEHRLSDRWSLTAGFDFRVHDLTPADLYGVGVVASASGALPEAHGSLTQIDCDVMLGITYHIPR